MSLSRFSIQRPVFAWILMFGLIFFGAFSFKEMGINDNPDVDFPRITIDYAYDGATPEVIEKDVIENVENVLVSMEGLRKVSSTADRGTAQLTLEFQLTRDIDFALQEVQTLLGRAQRSLPDAVDPPVVTKSNAADEPLMYINVSSQTLSDRDLMILYRDIIRDRMATVEGVAETRAYGYHEPQLRIDLDPQKLKRFELTASDVVASIQREHSELPAGRLEKGDSETNLRIMGEAETPEEFENMIISRRGGQANFAVIRLKDVAKVYEGIENLRRISRFNGHRALAIAVQKQTGVNAVATADRVIERIQEVNAELPQGTEMNINFDRTRFIRESVNELIFTLFLSALLTSIICWLFLGSWSATLNIVLAIPTAIIGTFIFINWLGFTLNNFSLLGLALAIGVVVDDAIIMLENIVRYMQQGWDRVNASFKGAREISFAVIATSAALISVFVPITFMNSIEGKFFFEFAVTIAIAVALSSVEALTLAPMRCSQFLKLDERRTWVGRNFEAFMSWLKESYHQSLVKTLQRPWIPIVFSSLFFVGSLYSFGKLPTEFAPAQDTGVLFVVFIGPEGKSLEYTKNKIIEFEEILNQNQSVERHYMAIGGFGRGGKSNRGIGIVVLKDQREQNQFEVAQDIRNLGLKIEGMKFFVRDRSNNVFSGRRGGSSLEFTINGPDPQVHKELYQKLKEKMDESDLIVGVRSDDAITVPEAHIVPDREKAIERGVEIAEIAQIINTTFGGQVIGQYTQNGRRFDMWVQLEEKARKEKSDIDALFVRNNRNELVSLASVVKVVETEGPQQVYREDRIRGFRVDGNLNKGVRLGTAVTQVRQWADEIFPKNYYLRFDETPDSQLFDSLLIMILGLVIAYMVLAIQFNSFTDPWIIFLAIPFGLTGSVLGLLFGDQSLNVYSVIGILLTMGIVKKNSILLIEFTNQLRDRGMATKEALLESCPVRLRPILMTTLATLVAALPPALSLGPGNETRIPMALTVLGGVSLSTLFTLYLVPSVYLLISPQRRALPEESPETTAPLEH
jgi:multidrug efflux pump